MRIEILASYFWGEVGVSELIWIQGGGELATLPENAPHPAAVYLASLGDGSRRAMGRSLDLLVEIFVAIGGGEAPTAGVGLQFPLVAAAVCPYLRDAGTAAGGLCPGNGE